MTADNNKSTLSLNFKDTYYTHQELIHKAKQMHETLSQANKEVKRMQEKTDLEISHTMTPNKTPYTTGWFHRFPLEQLKELKVMRSKAAARKVVGAGSLQSQQEK